MRFGEAIKDTNRAFIRTFENALPVFRDFTILAIFFITLPIGYVFAVIYRMVKKMRNKYLEFYNSSFGSGKHCTKSWGLTSFEAGAASRQAEVDELKAKLAMYEREGYKLVPVETIEDAISELECSQYYHVGSAAYYAASELKKAMINATD